MVEPTPDIDELIDSGLRALDEDDLDQAEQILERAQGVAGENHVRVLHLAGLLAWARDDYERATGFLMQAADARPDRVEIYLDAAECLFSCGENDEAEAQVRAALELPGLAADQADDARLLLSQIRLEDADADEALELLEQIDASRKTHPAWLSTHATVLMILGRHDDAIGELERAVEAEPDDPDLHYQLALALEHAGRTEASRREMATVLDLDLKELYEEGEPPAPDFAQTQELRSVLEGVLEQLPDPLLQLVGTAPITVQSHATKEQVLEEGLNPRSILCFRGTPAGEGREAELTGIVIMRDILAASVMDEDDVEDALFEALEDEIGYFFKRDDFVSAEA